MGKGGDASALKAVPAIKKFTAKEVQKHCTEDDCWVVVRGKVSAPRGLLLRFQAPRHRAINAAGWDV